MGTRGGHCAASVLGAPIADGDGRFAGGGGGGGWLGGVRASRSPSSCHHPCWQDGWRPCCSPCPVLRHCWRGRLLPCGRLCPSLLHHFPVQPPILVIAPIITLINSPRRGSGCLPRCNGGDTLPQVKHHGLAGRSLDRTRRLGG